MSSGASSVRECGNRPSSRPIRKTSGNSSPLAAVQRHQRDARVLVVLVGVADQCGVVEKLVQRLAAVARIHGGVHQFAQVLDARQRLRRVFLLELLDVAGAVDQELQQLGSGCRHRRARGSLRRAPRRLREHARVSPSANVVRRKIRGLGRLRTPPARSRWRAANPLRRSARQTASGAGSPAVSLTRSRKVPRCMARASSISSLKLLSAARARSGSSCAEAPRRSHPTSRCPSPARFARGSPSCSCRCRAVGVLITRCIAIESSGFCMTFRYEIMSLISARS